MIGGLISGSDSHKFSFLRYFTTKTPVMRVLKLLKHSEEITEIDSHTFLTKIFWMYRVNRIKSVHPVTLNLKKLIKRRFHEIIFQWKQISRFSTLCEAICLWDDPNVGVRGGTWQTILESRGRDKASSKFQLDCAQSWHVDGEAKKQNKADFITTNKLHQLRKKLSLVKSFLIV